MKLVSYDKRGHRRLGALTGGRLVDLPDAVGHPVFPTTMEALVASGRGTVLDAARDALDRHDALQFAVVAPRLLAPLLPTSIRTVRPPTPARAGTGSRLAWYGMPGYAERDARCVTGPGGPLPADGASLEAWMACVIARPGRDLSPSEADGRIFGYTLMAGSAAGTWSALGPCVATPDELEPEGPAMTARVAGDVVAAYAPGDQPWGFEELVAHLSWGRDLGPGDVLGACSVVLTASEGSLVELEAAGIGVLRARLEPPAA